jgi:hypothetical protein
MAPTKLPPRKTICKCPEDVDPFLDTPNSLDNANLSTSMRLSERVRSLKPKKIYQGQPTHLETFGATFTTAKVKFRYTGVPMYFIITVQSETDKNDIHNFQVEERYLPSVGYKVVGLTPNTLYNVHVIANYVSGDVYPVNHDKKFRTSDAEGEVKDLTVIYPQNKRYRLQENTEYYTSFAIEFTPLNDQVDYRITLPNVLDTPVDVSYENMVIIKNTQGKYHMEFDPSVEIPFDTSYIVSVETLYGEDDDRYIYTATLPFKTLNEQYTSAIDLSYIYNRSADLNYSEITDVSGVQYKIYLDDIEKYEHKTYSNNGSFHFDNLSINQSYEAQVSAIFPTTNNEYINFPYSFKTLNESESGFENVIVKNKSIDISFIDASGTNEIYDITITPTDGVVSDICYNTRNVSYTNLPINTTYTISIQVTYPPITNPPNSTDISNVYVVTQGFTTLNQDVVTELRAVEIPKMNSDVVISYQHAPDFKKTGFQYQIQLEDEDNNENSDISSVSNLHTEYIFTNISSGTYTYLVTATYLSTDISPSYSYTTIGSIDVETLSPGFLIVSTTDTEIYGTSITFVKDNDGKTNHNSYDISYVDENNNSFFIEDIKTWIANTTYTIENLKSNTTYYYTIYGKYIYDTPLDKYATSGSFTTRNEDKPIMLSSTVTSSSINLRFHSIGDTNSTYIIDLRGNDFDFTASNLSYNQTGSLYLIDSLTPNTKYNGDISVTYPFKNHIYNKLFNFTTPNEGPATTTVQVLYNHPVHGDKILINNDLIQEGNIESITNELCLFTDGSVQETLLGSRVMFAIPNINTFATPYNLNNLHDYFVRTTVQYKNYDPFLFFVYESGNYVSNTDIFKPIMKDAIATVQNTSIRLDWIDYRITNQVNDSDISYSIQITDITSGITISDTLLDYTVQDYTVIDLSINTTYNVDFSRLYNSSLSISDEIFPTKTITTLYESYIPDVPSTVIINTMNPDNLIVFDLKNINPIQVEENKLVLDNSSEYIAHDFLIDLNLDNSITTINGKIETKYRNTESNNPYIYYETKTYVSPDFSFNVLPATNVNPIEHIRNSQFDISSTDISYQFSPDTGIVRAVPPEWSGHLLYAVDNSNGTLYGHKYLDLDAADDDIDQHMMLSSGAGFSIYLPELTQYVFDYFYRNYYEVSFYVANHLVANTPYGNKEIGHLRGTTSPNIEYQIQLVGVNGVLYESNPIVSTDTEWNKIEMKFFNPRTVRNVKLRIQRNSLELNHLYISNVSIRSLHQEFSPVPSSIQIAPNKWSVVEDGPYDDKLQWNKMYKNAEDQTVLQLSTNMTIGFWLYIHENRTIDKKGIFVLGNSSDVNAVNLQSNNIISLYMYKNKLILENQMHYSQYTRHSIEFSYTVGIPIYYQIVYQNGMVFIYQNGEKKVESTPKYYIKEASPNQVLYIGTPGQLFDGFIYRDVQFYNFPFTSTQAKSVYERLKLEYYSINNQTALLNSDKRILVELDSLSSTNPHQDKTVDIILHNGEKLTRTIRFYEMKNDIFPFAHEINSPFTISFWLITPSSFYSTYYLDGPVISLQDCTNNAANGTCDKIVIKSVQGDLYLYVHDLEPLNELIVEKYWKDKNSINHFTWVYNEGTIQIYKNGFLFVEKKDDVKFGTIQKTVNQIKLAQHGWISELQYFSESLDEKDIFSLYVNHYRSGVSYDINGGIYTISYPPIDGNDVSFVNYKIDNNEPHANTLTVPITGTMTVSEITGSSIDITMDPLQLNEFHKQGETFDIILDDYGMSTTVDGSNRLYIKALGLVPNTDHVLEGTTLQLKLENLPVLNEEQTRPSYSYTISGENIDESDICGGSLTGTIQETTNIIIRDDYKTEGLETCIITIQELNLATTIDICDNAQNLLSVDKPLVDTDDTFIITMTWPNTWPNNTTLGTSVPYTITRGSDFVTPNVSTGVFTKPSDGSFTVTSEYTVNTILPQQFFTIEIDNFDSKVNVLINDFIIPRITVFKLGEPTVNEINEGEDFEVLFEVPINWRTDITEYPYVIEGIKFNVNDISSSSDPNYSGGIDIDKSMTGIFKLDFDNENRRSRFTYTASENLTIESDEVFKVKLLDPVYKAETPSAIDISYEIISNDFTVVNTAYQPYYLLNVGGSVDLNGTVYYINEGRTFTISLLTSRVTGTIPYRITGLEQADLESGTINGGFTLPDITTLSFTLREDTTTEGEENFSFDLLADEIVISKQFVLVDTSQFPNYDFVGVDELENKKYTITINNTNHPFMTSLQKAAVIMYQIDGGAVIRNDIKDINGNPVNNTGSFQFNDNPEYVLTYIYDTGGQFIFTITNFDGLSREVDLGKTE